MSQGALAFSRWASPRWRLWNMMGFAAFFGSLSDETPLKQVRSIGIESIVR